MMHGRGKMGAAPVSDSATHEWRRCPHVGVVSEFFYFLFFYGFALTQLQFVLISAESGRFGQNQIVSAESNRIVSVGSRNWPKRPKQAEIGLESCRNSWNQLWMRPKHPKFVIPQFYFEYLLLLLCFLFCFVFLAFFFLCFVNQGHIMCFLRIF